MSYQGRTVAVAHHTKNRADALDVFNSDVLVICHQALYAAKAWSVHDRERWHRISQWRGGDRLAGRALRRRNPCYEESSYAELPP
jgi:hypothetical protein